MEKTDLVMVFLKKNWRGIILLACVFFLPIAILHATCDPAAGRICNPIEPINNLNGFLKTILEGILKVGIPLVALAIIYCGFLFVQARGKPEALTKAKEAFFYALIGAAILLGSWALAQLISGTVLGIS